jgi:hypothetical protein
MAEGIADHHFVLPREVPYYGPGGLPFAYPPLSFYLMAAVTQVTGMSPLTYMRFMPPLGLVASVVAMFFLARAITASIQQATLAAVLFGISPTTFELQGDIGGVCRGVGLLAALVTVTLVYRAVERATVRNVILAAVFLAATILSHFAYAVFAAVSMAMFGLRRVRRMWVVVVIGVIAAVLTLPWWVLMIHRHGLQVFMRIADTHDGMGFVRYLTDPWALGGLLVRDVVANGTPLGGGSAILGVAQQVATGAWFVPGWLLATVLFNGREGARFATVVTALLSASILRMVSESMCRRATSETRATATRAVFFGVLLLLSYGVAFVHHAISVAPSLSEEFLTVAQWVREHSPVNSRYLLVSDDAAQHEMMTYFARREPLVSYFGAEWTGRYREQADRQKEIVECVRERSYSCVDDFIRRNDLAVDVIVGRVDPRPESIASRIEAADDWRRVYANASYAVWQRRAR